MCAFVFAFAFAFALAIFVLVFALCVLVFALLVFLCVCLLFVLALVLAFVLVLVLVCMFVCVCVRVCVTVCACVAIQMRRCERCIVSHPEKQALQRRPKESVLCSICAISVGDRQFELVLALSYVPLIPHSHTHTHIQSLTRFSASSPLSK